MLEGDFLMKNNKKYTIYSLNLACYKFMIFFRMGIEILSFTIKDVYDNVTYLQVNNSTPKYIF